MNLICVSAAIFVRLVMLLIARGCVEPDVADLQCRNQQIRRRISSDRITL